VPLLHALALHALVACSPGAGSGRGAFRLMTPPAPLRRSMRAWPMRTAWHISAGCSMHAHARRQLVCCRLHFVLGAALAARVQRAACTCMAWCTTRHRSTNDCIHACASMHHMHGNIGSPPVCPGLCTKRPDGRCSAGRYPVLPDW
jgi:hypothetical protein